MMKKNEKRKNSTMKKLIPAAGMLALSASMLATSTYAWFTMSREVKVSGMELKTTVSGNLLISDSNAGDAYYGTQLLQARSAILEPVSSLKGVDGTFFYTLDASADGSKRRDTATDPYIAYTAGLGNATGDNASDYANKFSQDYGVAKTGANTLISGLDRAEGYIDYTFYLKASPDSANNEIRMTKCNLSYNDVAISDANDLAWRIAVFAEETSAQTQSATPSSAVGKLVGLYALDGAEYFEDKAVTGTTTTATATVNDANCVIATGLTAASQDYYKVVVRVWLEGQDTTCKTDNYVDLDDSWKLDLKFELVPSGDATPAAIEEIETGASTAVTNDVPAYTPPATPEP